MKMGVIYGLAAVLAAATGVVSAHGGGLNAQGCHNERATGGYHCHRSSSSLNVLKSMQSVQDAGESGRQAGMAQREHEARLRLLEAQAQQADAARLQLEVSHGRNQKSLSPYEAGIYQAMPASEILKGFRCTDDCSGHDAGYQWAEDNDVTVPYDCGGNSDSFIEGCEAWANENG